MGCTSSNRTTATKDNSNPSSRTITDDGQQLIPDHFRKWLKTNRPKADEYVLNDVLSTAPVTNEAEDYRNIVGKALDLVADRHDIKSTNKLGKIIQKEISLASPRKVAHTISILKQTAEKLRDGELQLDTDASLATSGVPNPTNQEGAANSTESHNKPSQVLSGEPGIGLRDALEKARVLFYKGKQAAIFANPNGGYDVRIVDDNDDTIHHDGNLLRSIIVTEVKMRPKGSPATITPQFIPPPPPTTAPPSSLLDENEVTDDFRRSIDAALKGLEAVYQVATPSQNSAEKSEKIHVDKIKARASSPPAFKIVQCGVTNVPIVKSKSKEQTALSNIPETKQDSTINLAEIIRQMGEQQKMISNRLAAETNVAVEPIRTEIDIRSKSIELDDEINELMMDSIEMATASENGSPMPSLSNETIMKLMPPIAKDESEGDIERMIREMKEHGEKFQSRESLPTTIITSKQPSSYSLGLTSPLQNEPMMTTSISRPTKTKLRSDNRPKSFIVNDEILTKDRSHLNKQISLDGLANLAQTGLSNPNLPTSTTKLGISTSSGKIDDDHARVGASEPLTKVATSISQILEEHQPIIDEPIPASSSTAPAPNVTPVETSSTTVKSPVHNVTYTEIIHSESRDGEQSRRFITESYNEHPSNEEEQTTMLKVVTKSEFSNHPTTGEKIMEQCVQVITVKVRNETIKTTIQQASIPLSSTDNAAAYERRPVSELVKNFEMVTGNNHQTDISS